MESMESKNIKYLIFLSDYMIVKDYMVITGGMNDSTKAVVANIMRKGIRFYAFAIMSIQEYQAFNRIKTW